MKTSGDKLYTVSSLALKLDCNHNNKELTCIAKTSGLDEPPIVKHPYLFVQCKTTFAYLLIYSQSFSDFSSVHLSMTRPVEGQMKVGDNVTLTCEADASPLPHKIIWHKDVVYSYPQIL